MHEAARPVARLDAQVHDRVEPGCFFIPLERHVLRVQLDRVMDERAGVGREQHPKDVAIRNKVEGIVGADAISVPAGGVEIIGANAAPRRLPDPVQQDIGPERRPAADEIPGIARIQGERRPAEFGGDVSERHHHMRRIGRVQRGVPASQQAPRTVQRRVVEPVFANVPRPEEDEVEERRQPHPGLTLVEPEFCRDDLVETVEALSLPRLAQQDEHAAAIGHPTGTGRVVRQ